MNLFFGFFFCLFVFWCSGVLVYLLGSFFVAVVLLFVYLVAFFCLFLSFFILHGEEHGRNR